LKDISLFKTIFEFFKQDFAKLKDDEEPQVERRKIPRCRSSDSLMKFQSFSNSEEIKEESKVLENEESAEFNISINQRMEELEESKEESKEFESELSPRSRKTETRNQQRDDENLGQETMDLFLSGLRVVLLNDQGNTYSPIMDINISEIHFERHLEAKRSKGQTSLHLSLFYYNAQLGEWEPFIESFRLFCFMDNMLNKSSIVISADKGININLSDIVLQNLIESFKQWKKIQKELKLESDDLFASIDNYQSKELSKMSLENYNSLRATNHFRKFDRETLKGIDEDLAAPVSITNLTGKSLSVHRTIEEEESNKYRDTSQIEPNKVYQPIRVEFENEIHKNENDDILYDPIEQIELSKLHCRRHKLSEETNEHISYGVHLKGVQKVLTLRTEYTIHNQTIFDFILRVYDKELNEYTIKRGDKFPLTNNIINTKCSLAIQAKNEDWSESFDPIQVLEALTVDKDKTYLAHGLSYTFLCKQRDDEVEICYNLALQTPIIIKNCLPFNIDIKTPRSKHTLFILKGEESHFLNYDLIEPFAAEISIDGFEYTSLVIDPRTVGDEVKLKIKDIDKIQLTLFVKIQKERAGLELIIYNKVSILNYAGLNFEFFTSSK
jgi:hypothetical protein